MLGGLLLGDGALGCGPGFGALVEPLETIDLAGEYIPDLAVAGAYVTRLDVGGAVCAVLAVSGTFGVNIMAIKATLGGKGKMFVGEDKTLRLTGVVDADGIAVDMTGWTVRFVAGPITKAATISGIYHADPAVNTQVAEVAVTNTDSAALQAQPYEFSWKRLDAGFHDVLAYGDWPVEETSQ